MHFLTEDGLSRELVVEVDVAPEVFNSKLEMMRYLNQALAAVPREELDTDVGIWGWLTLYYFQQLAPVRAGGHRKLLAEELYIPSPHYQRKYRHLLIGPYIMYRQFEEKARLFLSAHLYVWSDVEEQFVGVQDMTRMRGAIEAADLLYFDPKTGGPKRGITNRKKGGTIRRLRAVIQQLDLTYDVHSLSGEDMLRLLPSEFDRYKPTQSIETPAPAEL
jgi:hypothetical protein